MALFLPRVFHSGLRGTRALPGLSACVVSARPLATSSTVDRAAETSASSSASAARKAPSPYAMTFNEYRALKSKVSLISKVGGIPFAALGLVTSSAVFTSQFPHLFDGSLPPEQIPLIFGMDPLAVAGITGCVSATISYFAGVGLVGQIWRAFNGKKATEIDARDADFVERITKHRLPSLSMTDDYYGDKIKTLVDYKKWLRVQRKRVATPENDAKRNPFEDFGKKKRDEL